MALPIVNIFAIPGLIAFEGCLANATRFKRAHYKPRQYVVLPPSINLTVWQRHVSLLDESVAKHQIDSILASLSTDLQ